MVAMSVALPPLPRQIRDYAVSIGMDAKMTRFGCRGCVFFFDSANRRRRLFAAPISEEDDSTYVVICILKDLFDKWTEKSRKLAESLGLGYSSFSVPVVRPSHPSANRVFADVIGVDSNEDDDQSVSLRFWHNSRSGNTFFQAELINECNETGGVHVHGTTCCIAADICHMPVSHIMSLANVSGGFSPVLERAIISGDVETAGRILSLENQDDLLCDYIAMMLTQCPYDNMRSMLQSFLDTSWRKLA